MGQGQSGGLPSKQGGSPKHLEAMESGISGAISSCFPIEGRNYLVCYLPEARGQWAF
jgi:hypothetical protein